MYSFSHHIFVSINGFCNSFISLVPDEIKTSALIGDAGYDTYLRDAHRQVNSWSYFNCIMFLFNYLSGESLFFFFLSFLFLFHSVISVLYRQVHLAGPQLQCPLRVNCSSYLNLYWVCVFMNMYMWLSFINQSAMNFSIMY